MSTKNTTHQERVARGFSYAAKQYAQHARIQARSAQNLWLWAQQQRSPWHTQPAALVDIGCGTGFLTQHLLGHCPGMAVHAIDMAPNMLQTLRAQLQHPHLHTHCLDACQLQSNTLSLPQPVWLFSNLCMQWFDNLPQAFSHWLGFAQTISVAILLDGSFSGWKAAHQASKQACQLRPLPSIQSILQSLETLHQQGRIRNFQHHTVQYIDPHPDGLAFARSLKAIGAHTPTTHQPSQLRRVLAALRQQQSDGSMNYDIGFFHLEQ
jgi:malonyl-CoA O-methyltransferase